MSVDATRYLEMERAFYADLVARSNFASEAFTHIDDGELVVGSYAQHEAFDYERWLIGGIRLQPGALALEYGCGPGRMLLRFAPHVRRVDGIDISADILAVARRRCAKLAVEPRLFLTDGQHVPDGLDGVYDLAFSVICLQHISVYTVRRRILEGLFRALKPGGVLAFQMGYGPGHANMVDYLADFIDAPGTNGIVDVGVLHPAEIAGDLADIGFTSAAYALTPSGPGDTHGAWIFVRATKPGTPIAAIETTVQAWSALGFLPLQRDETAAARARQLHRMRGILAQVRDLKNETIALRTEATGLKNEAARLKGDSEETRQRLQQEKATAIAAIEARLLERERALTVLETERRRLEDELIMARSDRDRWRRRAEDAVRDQAQLRQRVDIDEQQLLRVKIADRRRVSALIDDVVRTAVAANTRVGVLGSGAHTEWLLRETTLGAVPQLFFFDSDASRAGTSVRGNPVRASREIAGMALDAVIVSSLAFQEEMVTFLESLSIPGTRIIRCYP